MKKMNNNGFTLVETLLCFVILGIIMVVAAQIIHSSTEVYYYNRSMSYGMQASQIVSTEIRGELEDALPMLLYDTGKKRYGIDSSNIYININNDQKFIEFINSDGRQIKYQLVEDDSAGTWILKKYVLDAYDINSFNKKISDDSDDTECKYSEFSEGSYDSKHIGMGYEVHDISFEKFVKTPSPTTNWDKNKGTQKLSIGDYPVLVMTIKVGNNQYDEYECKEYIALYNFYGLVKNDSPFESIINIVQ